VEVARLPEAISERSNSLNSGELVALFKSKRPDFDFASAFLFLRTRKHSEPVSHKRGFASKIGFSNKTTTSGESSYDVRSGKIPLRWQFRITQPANVPAVFHEVSLLAFWTQAKYDTSGEVLGTNSFDSVERSSHH